MTELIFNEKDKQLEVSVRIFTDDLEKGISAQCQCKIDFAQVKDSIRTTRLLNEYLNSVVKIKVNQRPILLKMVGFEKEEESIWTYLQAPQIEPIRLLEIKNKILFETQKKQVNLVHFKAGNFDKTHQLFYPTDKLEFKLTDSDYKRYPNAR